MCNFLSRNLLTRVPWTGKTKTMSRSPMRMRPKLRTNLRHCPLVLPSLVAVLFFVFDFLRLAGAVCGFDGIVRLDWDEDLRPTPNEIAENKGTRGGTSVVDTDPNRPKTVDSEGWDGGALCCWRLGPVRPCPELAASLTVALLPQVCDGSNHEDSSGLTCTN
jgi:hypothetical protein